MKGQNKFAGTEKGEILERPRTIWLAGRILGLLSACCLLAAGTAFSALGQREVPLNRPYADLKRYHFGFFIGMNVEDFKIVNNGGQQTTDGQIYYGDVTAWSPGFSVGVIGNLSIVPNLDLRLLPTLHFGDRPVAFSRDRGQVMNFSVRSNYISLPLELKYSAQRMNNIRPFVAGGGYVSMEIGRRKDTPFYLKPFDYGVQVGLGCDIYFPFFKLSPQLTFCVGLPNVIDKNRPDLADDPKIVYTQAVDAVRTRMIVLTFCFE